MSFAAGRRGALLDVALAAAGLFYAGLLAVLSFEYSFEARVFALVAAIACLATGVAYFVAALREVLSLPPDRFSSEERSEMRTDARRLAFVAALVIASVLFMYLFGVYAYSFVFSVVFLRAFAARSWRTSLLIAVGLTLFNYAMFALLFDLRFDAVGVLLP